MIVVDLLSLISSDLVNGIKTAFFLLGSAVVLRETTIDLLDLLRSGNSGRDQDNQGS